LYRKILKYLILFLVSSFNPLYAAIVDDKEDSLNLHRYSNEKLLAQGHSELKKSTEIYSPTLRAIIQNEHQLKIIDKKLSILTSTKEVAPTKAEESKKMSLMEATVETRHNEENNLKINKEIDKLLRRKKRYLDKLEVYIKSALLHNQMVIDTLGHLNLFQVEIASRIDDGTLDQNTLPLQFQKGFLSKKREMLNQQKDSLITQSSKIHSQIKILLIYIQENQDKILVLNSKIHILKKEIKEEQKSNIFKKQLFNHKPEYLYTLITDMNKEWLLIKNNLKNSETQFKQVFSKKIQFKSALNALMPPKGNHPQLFHLEEVEFVLNATNDWKSYYSRRLEKLQVYLQQLTLLEQKILILETDEILMDEHILEMLAILEVLNEKSVDISTSNKLIPVSTQKLLDTLAAITEKSSKMDLQRVKMYSEIAKVNSEIKDINLSVKEIDETIDDLVKLNTIKNKQGQWTEKFRNLDLQSLIEKFNLLKTHLDKEQKRVNAEQAEFIKDHENVLKDVRLLEELKDPLLRNIEKEEFSEKKSILETLYLWAHLPLKYTENVPNLIEEKSADKLIKDEFRNNIFVYTSLLNTQKYDVDLLIKDVTEIEKLISEFMDELRKLELIQLEYYITAIELKKRLGHKQPKDIDPNLLNDVVAVLHSNFQEEIDNKIEETNKIHSEIKNINKSFSNKTSSNIEKNIHDTLFSLEKLISVQVNEDGKLKRLGSDLKVSFKNLNTIEQQSIEQKAYQRLKMENNAKERFFEYLSSKQTTALTKLLHSYYIESFLLEGRKVNLNTQKEAIALSMRYSEQEEKLLIQLITLFQQYEKDLQARFDEEIAHIQILLMPEKAEEIIKNFQSTSNRHLVIPSPITEKQKSEVIHSAADMLFYLHIHKIAMKKWQDIMKDRLSNTGIFQDRDLYQKALADIEKNLFSNTAKIQKLIGQDKEQILAENKITTEVLNNNDHASKVDIATPIIDQKLGEIAKIRHERFSIGESAMFILVSQIIIIILASIFLSYLTNRVIRYLKSKHNHEVHPQKTFILTALNTFTLFNLWIFAFLAILSILGFSIGAILAGLGIGGLALAFAAKDTLSNIIGGITIFLEQPFSIGDVVQIGNEPAQMVVDMSWRSVVLVNSLKYQTSIPNNQATSLTLINYTKVTPARTFIDVFVSPEYEAEAVLTLLVQSLDEVGDIILQDELKDAVIIGIKVFSDTTLMQYRARYYVKDYQKRGGANAAIWGNIKRIFTDENILLTVVPYETTAQELTVSPVSPKHDRKSHS
jgi:small-conductance mechanosensitive channel